jgi:hypothetical protein
MLQYLTPTTLEEMYKDLDEARLELIRSTNGGDAREYSELTTLIEKIDTQYQNITGKELWVKMATA